MIDARRLLRHAVLILCFGLPVSGAHAAAETPTPQERSLQGFGAQTLNCVEWSDSCSICLRDESGAMHCSTPGIACQPEAIACRREKAR
jgi:hypothetical protein